MYPKKGQKMKTNEIKLIKSFIALQENISQEKKKLSNKYHDLELSHNRKIKGLEKIKTLIENYPLLETDKKLRETITKICENALFCNGRERSKICNG